MHDPSLFISWAKIGKQIPVNLGDLKPAPPQKGNPPINDEPMPTQRRSKQIAQLCPLFYEKIHSADVIQVGDHIIQSHSLYWFHCMVTERDDNPIDTTKFKAIYQFRTAIEEKEISLDPSAEKLYRIKYLESLPTDIAIENARSRLGEHSLSPMARMKFVRWAKTGSEEGIEVGFLSNEALPVSKSRIWSFGQLNRGDYLVEIANKTRTHHYLVTEVQSPINCLAIESWAPYGMAGTVIETEVSFEKEHDREKEHKFYRINYNHGACFTTEETVQKADPLIGSTTTDKMWSDINRQKFVNFVKTGESEVIEVSQFNDDRLLLPRSRVESALELQPGDHLERPMCGAKMFNHHMIVTQAVNKRRCKVIHFGSSNEKKKKAELLEEEVHLFVNDCVFRIHYSERINPEDTIRLLRELIRDPKPQIYHFVGNNCEHVVMKATIGHPVSIQVAENMYKALQFTKRNVLKPIAVTLSSTTLVLTGGVKVVAKLTVHGATILGYATKAAGEAAAKAGGKAAFKAGAKAGAKAVFKLGYRAAASGTAVGAVGGIAIGVNVLFEGPLLTRELYNLHQQKKFGIISDTDYRRGIIKQSFTTGSIILGGVGRALVGQVAIPVPVLGAAVGGMVGSVVGQGVGAAEGWLASQVVLYKTVTLPYVITLEYTEYPSEE